MTPVLFAGAKKSLVAALRTIFNFLALNLALVVASLPIVTLPLAVNAATVALERWRAEGEDRVVREFVNAMRSRSSLRTVAQVGGPLLATMLAVEEVHFFARGGSPENWLCLGSGVAALVITTSSAGYALLLSVRQTSAPAVEVWSVAAKLSLQNVFVTGPLFVLEAGVAVLLGFLDPALLLLGLPLGFLQLARVTARLGVRRASAPGRAPVAPMRRRGGAGASLPLSIERAFSSGPRAALDKAHYAFHVQVPVDQVGQAFEDGT